MFKFLSKLLDLQEEPKKEEFRHETLSGNYGRNPASSWQQLPAGLSSARSRPYADLASAPSRPNSYSYGVASNTATRPASTHAQSASSGATRPVASGNLATSAVSIVSHTHGRQRRDERGIDRRQLQEAVKYGRKERANPGRDGKPRWRYMHKGIVYITDETSRHEITSWKLDDALEGPPPPVFGQAGAGKSHMVAIIDSSGSMRKDDVPGYPSRTAAVYDCLARELVEPQLKVGGSKVEVSVIAMSDEATVVLERHPLDRDLLTYLQRRKTSYARSHGNYLPALDKALELLKADAAHQSQLFLIFLSDGAPSDHTTMTCSHGYAVWQQCPSGRLTAKGRPLLINCPYSKTCRSTLHIKVRRECVEKVKEIGDLLGRDRVFIGTVAFGPPSENYDVLKSMAEALPRSSFQMLGLSVACLHTAFTSLASSLATMLTEAATPGLTLRSDISIKTERQTYDLADVILDGVKWDVYCGQKCRAKRGYDPAIGCMVDMPFSTELTTIMQKFPDMKKLERGVAHAMHKFGEGAERVVFQCTEVVSPDGGCTGYCVGPRLVAKSTRYMQHMSDDSFHRAFCRIQVEAEALAQLFNRRLAGRPEWQVRFLPCFVYTLEDPRWPRGVVDILVEEELEGKFTKWNDNKGGVTKRFEGDNSCAAGTNRDNNVNTARDLGAIVEEEDEEADEEADEGDRADNSSVQAEAEHVPQCFSHFTYHVTDGRKLVCDLQGVWNAVDGFVLTDPVIHHHTGSKHNGATDKGPAGIRSFFSTHVCNPLCARLGLPPGPTC